MTSLDLLGIGNAIVDVIAPVPSGFPEGRGMVPGSMTLIDAAAAEALTASLPHGQTASGGSVANSCAVASMLGARVAFSGKVAADALGYAFTSDLLAAGVAHPTEPLTGDLPTARCLVLVTPDGQRTMNTYLGACTTLQTADLDPAAIARAAIVYLEGYLFEPASAQAAMAAAATMARAAGGRVALSLSDAFCVDRHRDAFRTMLPAIDILFANEAEITSLYQTDDFAAATARAAADVGYAVLTRGGAGSLIATGGTVTQVAAVPTEVVDTTGAGDCYAAGVLAGIVAGAAPAACGALGAHAAAMCIGAYGARPSAPALAELRARLPII